MADSKLLFSICTLVTSHEMYQSMKISFINAGFDETNSEFLFLDNSENNIYDAYCGLNILKKRASGQYIIFCHQDIEILANGFTQLNERITEITKLNLKWAVLSNCGAKKVKEYALCVLEGDGKDRNTKNFPMEVYSVDEHFFLIKNNQELKFSEEKLEGYHLYGTDICLQAILHGYKCYAIEFKLKHYGSGNLNSAFYVTKQRLIQSYEKMIDLGWVQTTCTRMFISTSPFLNKFMNLKPVSYLAKKYYQYFPIT